MPCRSRWLSYSLLILTFILMPRSADAGQEANERSINIEDWLVLGPVAHPLPVFQDSDKGGFDFYVDQSPLFRADQARVPILLTHGTSDTNVPRGESDAFYIALKLLGKTVEYVQVEGQDHHILAHDKRVIWSSTILAWFDRWLKDQPEWWNELYP